MVQNIADQFSRHERWRAAAEKHTVHWPDRAQPMRISQFGAIGGQPVLRVGGVFMRRVNVKIAIGTNGRTKRPMQINAERRHIISFNALRSFPHFGLSAKHAATNWAKASARCDMACLASGFISPKVKSPPSGRKSGHSRNRFYRASATPDCPQPCPQNFRHGRQAKPKTGHR